MATANFIVLSLRSLPEGRGGVCTLWYKGMPHQDLLTFEAEGWRLAWEAMGGSISLPDDEILLNMKLALNQLLQRWDFDQQGPVGVTKALAERWFR